MAWAEEGGEIVNIMEAANYNMADDWDREAVITPKGRVHDREGAPEGSIPFVCAGIDVQRGHFWVVVRAFSKTGHSRLKAFAKVDTWGNVEAFVKKHRVHPALVVCDSGDQSQEVYRQTAMRGWKCSKGSGNEDFSVTAKDGSTVRRFYSDKQAIVVPGLGQRATLIVFSNLAIKDLLYGLRSRKVFSYALDAGQDYVDQLNSEVRVKDKKTGKPHWILPQGKTDNHALDCELLALLAAVRWGIIGKESTETDLPSQT
jgi:hypothetical protein